MKKVKETIKNIIVKHGSVIAACAFVFVSVAANSSCFVPYYEPEEPANLDRFKKFNK